MGFDDKLRQLAEEADLASLKTLKRTTKDLAEILTQVLHDHSWDAPTMKVDRALKDLAEKAKDCARYRDAAGYLDEKVFAPATARIEELLLKIDLQEVQAQRREKFETREWSRGFVYVAWTERPERYLYVGKAGSADRLNLISHGKLAFAAGQSTRLALIFPSQSREDILLGVEAAVMAVIEFKTGELPRFNERRERPIKHKGHNSLRELAHFLESVSADLHERD